MSTRVFVAGLAIVSAMGLALNANAESPASTSKASTSPSSPVKHSPTRHHKMARHAAHGGQAHLMHTAAARWIERDAWAQSRIAADLGRGRLAPQKVAALETQAAEVYRTDARYLLAPTDTTARMQVASQERDLTRAVAQAEREHVGARDANPLDRMHARVATWRDAEQQRWIAQELRHDRLSVFQAAALEHEQARIVADQAGLERRGHESLDDALRMQHQQDVQDWAIRTAHVVNTMSA